jgi:hypothetical protein
MAQPIINFAVVEVAKPNIGKWKVLVFGCFQWHYKDEVNVGGASWIVASLWPIAPTVVMGFYWFSTWGWCKSRVVAVRGDVKVKDRKGSMSGKNDHNTLWH